MIAQKTWMDCIVPDCVTTSINQSLGVIAYLGIMCISSTSKSLYYVLLI